MGKDDFWRLASMRAKMLLIGLIALLLGADTKDADTIKEVEKAVRAINEAFQKGDAATVGRLMTDNHIAITPYYGGPQDKAEQLKTLPDTKLSEYGMGTVEITLLNKETAVVTYPLTLKGTYKGKPVPAQIYAAAVWVLHGGKWLEAFYQETALDGK
jgi:ketosteroid isomerase-like protein